MSIYSYSDSFNNCEMFFTVNFPLFAIIDKKIKILKSQLCSVKAEKRLEKDASRLLYLSER